VQPTKIRNQPPKNEITTNSFGNLINICCVARKNSLKANYQMTNLERKLLFNISPKFQFFSTNISAETPVIQKISKQVKITIIDGEHDDIVKSFLFVEV
jgi:hypothetical protein